MPQSCFPEEAWARVIVAVKPECVKKSLALSSLARKQGHKQVIKN